MLVREAKPGAVLKIREPNSGDVVNAQLAWVAGKKRVPFVRVGVRLFSRWRKTEPFPIPADTEVVE